MTTAVAMTATLCAFGVNAHAAENNEKTEYGVIEETPDGNLIGSDVLTDQELEEILGSKSDEADITTFEIPQIDDVVEYRAVVDSTDHEDVVVEETTEDEVSDATDVVEDTDYFVDFTDDYLDEEPVVKGDVLEDEIVDSTDHDDVVVEETKKEDNNFFVDFTDDYVESEEKGDILPEPTPEPEPEPTPEPEPVVPEITEPESEVPVEPTPIYTPVKTSVVDEFVPQVLGDSLFEAPKTGDTFTLLSVIAGMILSFGLLAIANKRRRM